VAALFVRRAVLQDSRKWNEAYREMPGDRDGLDRVARDPDGLTFAPVSDPPRGAKRVALARDAGQAAVLPDPAALTDGRYPLVRSVDIVVAHDKGVAVPPPVARFADYILSPAGQAIVGHVGPYLPLGAAGAEQARRGLEAAR
jgi:phosphate transport system substrate-binding protein